VIWRLFLDSNKKIKILEVSRIKYFFISKYIKIIFNFFIPSHKKILKYKKNETIFFFKIIFLKTLGKNKKTLNKKIPSGKPRDISWHYMI
jgi:hypothetical protein